MAAMDSTRSLPLLRAAPTGQPYPLLDLLDGTTLLRRDLCDGEPGVMLRLALQLLNPADGGRPIERAAVYCWHGGCRGVQVTGPDGDVRFDTLYPAPEADGIARLHLQVFLLSAGQVVGVSLADLVLPAHTTALVGAAGGDHPGACDLPAAEPPLATPVLLARLPGSPAAGFDAELALSVVLDGPRTPQRRASDAASTPV